MNETWDMERVFPGGARSSEFRQFLRQLDEDINALQERVTSFAKNPTDLAELIENWQLLTTNLAQSVSYVECLTAADTSDAIATQLGGQLDAIDARLRSAETEINKRMTELTDDSWSRFISQERFLDSSFFLNRQRSFARQKMDPKLESLAENLAASGYHAWGRLYDKIAGSLRVKVNDKDGIQTVSIGQLVHRLEDPDFRVRQVSFRRMEEAWCEVQDLAAITLNSQAGFRLSLYESRGWESILQEPLFLNRLEKNTLEAMWSVVATKSEKLLQYLDAKASLLGLDELTWADLQAPVTASEQPFEYRVAAEYIIERFSTFSGELGEFAHRAFRQRWIEVEDRLGKAAGGFCTDLPLSKETRIFMTFGRTFGSVSTLAHELGHAYHAWLLRNRPYFATCYPMTLAETASTFCETLVMDTALATATGEHRLSLLGKIGDEAVTMLMNLRARFLFETAFFKHRSKGPLTVDELNDLMVNAQREAFHNGLAVTGYHPLFWASKLHFYLTSMPFYNFPYVFGYLFSSGLSARASAEGTSFAATYAKMLGDSGTMTCEELALRYLGEDIMQTSFWESAVDRVLEVVPRFVEATKVPRR